ncbi:DUF4175 family protein, partial [Candidatus Latescibacterota bacterium]
RMIERAYPQLKDRLISAVQLGCLERSDLNGQSEDLINALIRKVEKETRNLELAKSVSSGRLLFSARILGACVIALLLLTAVLPGLMAGGLFRLVDYSHAYTRPGNISIYTLKRESSIIRGENFSTTGFVSGSSIEPLRVLYQWEDSNVWNVKPVDFDGKNGAFTMTIEKPGISFHYYLESGQFATPRHQVTVIERPVVEMIESTLIYPEYTGLGTISLDDNDGNVRALNGTRVDMTVKANKALKNMTVHWSDSTLTECELAGDTGAFAFTVTGTVDYHIELVDSLGITNSNPIEYRVAGLIDEEPLVAITSPISDVALPLSMSFPVIYQAFDDYGLSSAVLRFKLPFEEQSREIVLKKGMLGKAIEDMYIWDMSELGLLPEDSIQFYLAVYDNDTVNGPKQGISDTLTVRVPSMTDILTDTIDDQNSGIEKLRDISDRTGLDEKPLDEVKRNIINGKELDWSDRNAIEEAKKRMESTRKEISDVSEELKEIVDRLSEEDMAAIETLEKLQKIAQMMDELVDSELKEAVKRLTQATIKLEPGKLKEALDKHKVTAEDLKDKLDRIISFLEEIKSIQRFEMTKRLVEEISIKQAELTDKYEQQPDNSAVWREQEKLATEMKTLQDELKDVAKELEEKFGLDTGEFKDFLESKDLSETMKNTSVTMKNGQKERAEKGLQESNTMLSELLAQMDAMGAAMEETNTEELKRRLFKALVDLLAVSEKQENFLADLEKKGFTGSNAPDKDNLAKHQLEVIDAFSKAERSLEHLGEITVELSGVYEQIMSMTKMFMENSVDAFATGNIINGAENARISLNDLNKTVNFLILLMKSGQGGGKGMPGDLLQQLQKIANGELSLQMQMGTVESEQMMMQLAAEQQRLAEMLSELGSKIQEDKRLREMLDGLVKDMDDTADMMKKNEKRELVERKQLNIYRRLLDARRSRREKEETEDKRKSWTAKRNISKGAEQLAGDLGEKKQDLNEIIKTAMQDDFNDEYLRLIRRYFESMLYDDTEMIQPESSGEEQ